MTEDPSRLYLVTPPLVEADAFLGPLAAALDAAPIACLRLRMGVEDEDALRRAADRVREVAHARDVPLVLTDHYRMARPLGLDGVHLANSRLSVREARKELGEDAIVGAFAGASRHQGMMAAEAGADYVAFGPVVQDGLGDGEIADRELFIWWAEMIETPVVAEGGVDAATIRSIGDSADFFAIDDAVWEAPDGPAAALKTISGLLA